MLHTPDTSPKKILVDSMGHTIKWVKSFDDETNEAEIYVVTRDGNYRETPAIVEGEMFSIKVKIPGAKIIDKNRSK